MNADQAPYVQLSSGLITIVTMTLFKRPAVLERLIDVPYFLLCKIAIFQKRSPIGFTVVAPAEVAGSVFGVYFRPIEPIDPTRKVNYQHEYQLLLSPWSKI